MVKTSPGLLESKWPEKAFAPLIVLVLAAIIGLTLWITQRIKTQKLDELQTSLETVLKTTQGGLRVWARELDANVSALAQSRLSRQIVAQIVTRASPQLQAALERDLEPQISRHGYLGYAIVRPDGVQVAPIAKSPASARFLFGQRPRSLEEVFQGKFSIGLPFVPQNSTRAVMFAAAPVENRSGKVLAALVIYLDPSRTFSEMTRLGRPGESGETFAVDQSGEMVTQSRFVGQMQRLGLLERDSDGISQIELRDPGGNLLEGYKSLPDRASLPFTLVAQSILARQSGRSLEGYRDYRGVPVVGVWLWDKDLKVGLATQVDRAEAYRSLRMLQRLVWMIIGVVAFGGGAILAIYRTEARLRQVSYANEQANRARQELLAIVSHDLKNPLTSIFLMDELLLKTLPSGAAMDRRRRLLETMGRSAEQMRRMVDDLQIAASQEAGKLEIRPKEVVAAQLAAQVVTMFEPLAGERRISMRSKTDPELPDVWADEERLFQVFSNLVGNALKFTPEGGEVWISATFEKEMVRFSVHDTGPGIAPAEMARVFEKYWQAKETARKGMGLGLAIAKEIVESHGGAIWVESEIGRGTVFRFTIPTAKKSRIASVS